jgi:hypothetical protein
MNFKNYRAAVILLPILGSGNIAAEAETQINIKSISSNNK